MEDNDDWLASNKTLKKWTRIGDVELLSYAGIDFHKTIDKERLVKENFDITVKLYQHSQKKYTVWVN